MCIFESVFLVLFLELLDWQKGFGKSWPKILQWPQWSSVAQFRHVPTHSHWFEVVVDKFLEEDTTRKHWAADVTQLIVSGTFLKDKVVEEYILEETKEAAVRESLFPDPSLAASVKRSDLKTKE